MMNVYAAQAIAKSQLDALENSNESAEWIAETIARIPEYAYRLGCLNRPTVLASLTDIVRERPDFDLMRIHALFG
jgi:hypothetical protein